jgi:thymidylate synthase (FAD)
VSEEAGFDFIIPPSIKKDGELARYFRDFMNKAQEAYSHIVSRLNEKGLKGEEANQDARFILPNACETKIIITMNARELLHFFKQRCCNRAQWEIRSMAINMLRLVSRTAPAIFRNAGPGCLKGKCPEGDYTCGKMKEVREFFKNL